MSVYDLDAVAKEVADKTLPPFKFKYKKKLWQLEVMDALDIREILTVGDKTVLEQFALLLGEGEWEKFPKIQSETVEHLIEQYVEYSESGEGVSLEKSEPSTN